MAILRCDNRRLEGSLVTKSSRAAKITNRTIVNRKNLVFAKMNHADLPLELPPLRAYYVRTMRRRISTSGNSAALVLSQDLLGLMGIGVGDEVDVALVDRTLVVRPLPEVERAAKVQDAIDEVFRRDAGLLRRLGEGVTPDDHKTRRRK